MKEILTYRKIWLIAYPILISLLMEHLIGLTDTAFLGRVGEIELGASALGGVYYLALFMLAFGFSIGAQILIARRNGEGRYRRIGPLFRQGAAFLLVLAALLFFVSKRYTPLLLDRLIEDAEVRRATLDYLDWRIYGFFFSFLIVMFRAFYVGITRTRILTLNSVVMVLTNVALNYVLIFGKLGLPRLGISGAAIGSSLAELVSVLFFVLYTRLRADPKYRLFAPERFSWRPLKLILNVSVWTMLQAFISVATWFMFFVAVEHLGPRELAVSNIVRSISAMIFMVVSAFAATASSLAGNLMGAGEPGRVMPVAGKIIRLCYLIVIPLVALVFLFPTAVLKIYTDSPGLLRASVPSLLVMASVYFINVPAVVLFNTVSGTGNTRSALLLEFVTLTLYALYMVYVVMVLRADVAVCWTTEHVYGTVLLALSWLYLRRAGWQRKRI